jgi:predicted DNA repair protein MutK
MIGALLSEFLPWIITALAAIGGVWAYGRSKKAEGRKETYIETLADSAKRQKEGRDAVQDLRDADRDALAGRVRDNSDRW